MFNFKEVISNLTFRGTQIQDCVTAIMFFSHHDVIIDNGFVAIKF